MDNNLYASLGMAMNNAVLQKLRSTGVDLSPAFVRQNFVILSLLEQRDHLVRLLGDIPLVKHTLQADIKAGPDYTRLIKLLQDELAHIDQLMHQLEQNVAELKNVEYPE
ncbi:hypothetical protein [Methyloradius palustris]|uniref:Uncharacterized protein n=1 Tax=Methyloradius palustris TaxID=2778876 RepID=A0A8D5JXA5_9PROT|nr:hypothetical protein [Methyloradius palustris]BCM25934.1 hypothetical protein ZMTM_21930 [Methyloradius palustris]